MRQLLTSAVCVVFLSNGFDSLRCLIYKRNIFTLVFLGADSIFESYSDHGLKYVSTILCLRSPGSVFQVSLRSKHVDGDPRLQCQFSPLKSGVYIDVFQ